MHILSIITALAGLAFCNANEVHNPFWWKPAAPTFKPKTGRYGEIVENYGNGVEPYGQTVQPCTYTHSITTDCLATAVTSAAHTKTTLIDCRGCALTTVRQQWPEMEGLGPECVPESKRATIMALQETTTVTACLGTATARATPTATTLPEAVEGYRPYLTRSPYTQRLI